MEDDQQNPQQPPQKPSEDRMDIEDEAPQAEENKFNEYFSQMVGNPMDIEAYINNNFRLNKFYPQNHFFPIGQNKAHAGLPSEINKMYYKKMTSPSLFFKLTFFFF